MISFLTMYGNIRLLFNHILVLVAGLLLITCATPIGPEGGPRDQTGPVILSTYPETGTTRFRDDKIKISFDEFVDRDNIRSNISIEPDIGLNYSLDWRRKDLTISFEDPLPDSTTVILTLSGDLKDTRGNSMGGPKTIAFSTGDDIDEGNLSGKILNADTGKGVDKATVLLYRKPIDLSAKAAYAVRTDTGGVFTFSYLSEGEYQAVYVEDRNRNRIWDKERELARPFYRQFIELEEAGSDTLRPIYINKPDTTSPALLGVGMLSTNRFRLRFDEEMMLTDETDIMLTDSMGRSANPLLPLYVDPEDPFILYAHSSENTSPDSTYSLRSRSLTDLAGNELQEIERTFRGSATSDTTLQRIIGQSSAEGLFPSEPVEVVYAAPIVDPEITDSLVVAEGEVSFTDWNTVTIDGNRLLIYPQEETWLEGMEYQFLIWNPATRRRQLVDPEIWDVKELGAIEMVFEDEDSVTRKRAFLRSDKIDFEQYYDLSETLIFDDLAPVEYILYLFTDLNEDGEWQQGSVLPYEAPEPYLVRRGISVSSGFIAEVLVDL